MKHTSTILLKKQVIHILVILVVVPVMYLVVIAQDQEKLNADVVMAQAF